MIQQFTLSTQSLQKLLQVHPNLRVLVKTVARTFPCMVLEGYRGEEEQNRAVAEKRSKLQYPLSKHNKTPAEAVDLAPFPYDPNNAQKILYFCGYVMATAASLGLKVRCGADWNVNLDPADESFRDLFHFELI